MTLDNAETTVLDDVQPDAAVDAEMSEAYARAMASDDGDEQAPEAPRAPDGKFAPKQGEASPSDEAAKPEAEQAAAVAAPEHFPQSLKATWGNIPAEAQKALVDYQAEVGRKFNEVGRKLEQVQPVADVLTQALATMPGFQNRSAVQIAQGAAELAAVQHQLETGSPDQKAGLIREIAKMYGVDLGAGQAQQDGGNTDLQFLRSQVADLQRQLSQRQFDPSQVDTKVSQALEQRELAQQVDAISKELPFFADVEDDIAHYITRVKAAKPDADIKSVLSEAYDMAANANPTVRQKLKELEANKATTTTEDAKRKEAAKKAASINVKPSQSGKSTPLSEEEAMSAAYRRSMAN